MRLLLSLLATSAIAAPISKVVVLMLENRSFDHVLGRVNLPGAKQFRGYERLPIDLNDRSKGTVRVGGNAPNVNPCNPAHSLDLVTQQIFGTAYDENFAEPGPATAPMDGFVHVNGLAGDDMECGEFAVSNFVEGSLPAFHALAKEYAVFDNFFCSFPGETHPNRLFQLAGTSDGETWNSPTRMTLGYKLRSIFDDLDEDDMSWAVYQRGALACASLLRNMRTPSRLRKFHGFSQFKEDAAAGELPTFSWIEPNFFAATGEVADDMHPNNHDARDADDLVRNTYEALRNSPEWPHTLLVVTFDEHGGFWDHVSPPNRDIPAPDGKTKKFPFTRLGPRLPVLAVSAYTQRNSVIHTLLEHTSILKTLRKLLGMTTGPLSQREAWTNDFAEEVFNTDVARDDTPTRLPRAEARSLAHNEAMAGNPLTELHIEILHAAHEMLYGKTMSEKDLSRPEFASEGEAHEWLRWAWYKVRERAGVADAAEKDASWERFDSAWPQIPESKLNDLVRDA
ncbi:MAG: hypothetical protein MHM6MM_001190 [Cercozoa sp. M6MM]